MKVVAVIPCFDESEYIADVVFKSNELVGMSIVADDNSANGTAEKAEGAGAYIARNFGRHGAGANTKAGIDAALIGDCDIVVTLDGDGQHNPSEIPKLLEPIEKGDADVVIGSRFMNKGNEIIPRYRRFGIKVINWLYNAGRRDKVTDAQCCFRAFKREVLEQMDIAEEGFAFSTEMLIKVRKLGFRIKEVPVSVLYHRQFSRNSTLNPVRHGLSVALGTVKLRLKLELLRR